MHKSFLDKAIALNKSCEAYATATITRRKIPTSGKPGDKAIITADGKIHGWIGGGCTRGIVLKESLLAIKERSPRNVLISPVKTTQPNGNTKLYNMTCQSGGEVELYIEPVLPKPHLIIMGSSHIGMALCRIAKAMDYQVDVVMSDVDPEVFPEADKIINASDYMPAKMIQDNTHIIVCTQGEGDSTALHNAIKSDVDYISFVASRLKANAIFGDLRKLGVTMDELKKIKTPAGIDIGAKLPDEVAISILAQIINDFRTQKMDGTSDDTQATQLGDDYYMNPVCNIPIQKSTAKHVLTYKNEKVYFCCDGCKVSFEKEPAKYMAY